MSKNGEVFKTVDERTVAFQHWCKNAPQKDCAYSECTKCQFKWLELEYKDCMKNKDRFTSLKDARDAFQEFCGRHSIDDSKLVCDCPLSENRDCFGKWLDMEGYGV